MVLSGTCLQEVQSLPPSSLLTLQGHDFISRESVEHIPQQAVKRCTSRFAEKKTKPWLKVFFSLLRNKKVFSPVVLSGSRNCSGGCCCLGCQVYFHHSLSSLPEVSFLRWVLLPGSFPLFAALGRLIRGEISIAVTVYSSYGTSLGLLPFSTAG